MSLESLIKTNKTNIALPSANGLAENAGLAVSVASNAMTIALKGADGNDPSSTNIVRVPSSTQGTGSAVTTLREVTAALSVVIPASTTIGTANGVTSPVYVYAIDNSGTIELAVSTKWFGQSGIVTTVAISGGATSTTMYSTSARTSVPFVCLGVAYSSQSTAGTWASAPSSVQLAPLKLKQYGFDGYLNTGSVAWNGGSDVKVQIDTEVYDDDSAFDAATNYRFTCQEPGIYVFEGVVTSQSAMTDNASAGLLKNGSIAKRSAYNYFTGTGAQVSISASLKLVPGDYVELCGRYSSGSNTFYASANSTWFTGRISR